MTFRVCQICFIFNKIAKAFLVFGHYVFNTTSYLSLMAGVLLPIKQFGACIWYAIVECDQNPWLLLKLALAGSACLLLFIYIGCFEYYIVVLVWGSLYAQTFYEEGNLYWNITLDFGQALRVKIMKAQFRRSFVLMNPESLLVL